MMDNMDDWELAEDYLEYYPADETVSAYYEIEPWLEDPIWLADAYEDRYADVEEAYEGDEDLYEEDEHDEELGWW